MCGTKGNRHQLIKIDGSGADTNEVESNDNEICSLSSDKEIDNVSKTYDSPADGKLQANYTPSCTLLSPIYQSSFVGLIVDKEEMVREHK